MYTIKGWQCYGHLELLKIYVDRANAHAEALRIERIYAKAGEGRVTLSSIAASVSSGKRVGIDTHELNVILKVYFQVIYDLIVDLWDAMEGLLELAEEEAPLGSAKVRAVFSSGSGKVAGCMITTAKKVGAGLEGGIGVDDFDEWEEGDAIEEFDTVKKAMQEP
ncbi:hypothetical protein GUJ93_ZPchr0010g11209 [Zizania palustris]|uniref:Uncharacterized protein n=1 Tax=Zizania palustris TaxID=103762 RepID=A0A8J5WFD6_ZIZPA|nr:hypothetical protein GUJ93_ZPchr0010g11209 [Zizania palustris]